MESKEDTEDEFQSTLEEAEEEKEDNEEDLQAKLAIMHKLVKELETSLAQKAKAKGEKRDDKGVKSHGKRDAEDGEDGEKRVRSEVEFASPPAKLKKGVSFESLGSDSEGKFVEESWTPSPGPKQLTLAASLKKTGQDVQIVKVSSPGAKKQESLKDLLLQKVAALEAQKKEQTTVVGMEEEREQFEESDVVKNGNQDRWGNLRTNVGGRPRKEVGGRLAQYVGKANRKSDNDKTRRQEVKGAVQLKIAEELTTLAASFGEGAASRTEFWKAAKPIIGDVDSKRVDNMMHNKERLRERVEETKAGMTGKLGRGYTLLNNHTVEHLESTATRELGAGRPWHFAAHTKELKRWHEQERDRGHAVDKKDLQHEWEDRLEMNIELLKKSKETWTTDDAFMVRVMEEKLKTLREGTAKAQEKAVSTMCAKIGARLLVPSRCTQLGEKEEEVRAELSWQQMDERIFIAGLAEQEELKTWVADPQQFVKDREKTWLVFSDQVPIWIKIGMLKILYSAAELAEKGKHAQAAVKEARRKFNATHGKDSQRIVPAEPEHDVNEKVEHEMEEKVGEGSSGKKRKRPDLPSDIESSTEVEEGCVRRRQTFNIALTL